MQVDTATVNYQELLYRWGGLLPVNDPSHMYYKRQTPERRLYVVGGEMADKAAGRSAFTEQELLAADHVVSRMPGHIQRFIIWRFRERQEYAYIGRMISMSSDTARNRVKGAVVEFANGYEERQAILCAAGDFVSRYNR